MGDHAERNGGGNHFLANSALPEWQRMSDLDVESWNWDLWDSNPGISTWDLDKPWDPGIWANPGTWNSNPEASTWDWNPGNGIWDCSQTWLPTQCHVNTFQARSKEYHPQETAPSKSMATSSSDNEPNFDDLVFMSQPQTQKVPLPRFCTAPGGDALAEYKSSQAPTRTRITDDSPIENDSPAPKGHDSPGRVVGLDCMQDDWKGDEDGQECITWKGHAPKAASICALHDSEANDLVYKLLTEPQVPERVNVAFTLGKRFSTSQVPKEVSEVVTDGLVQALEDKHFKVRAAAAHALGTFGPAVAMHSNTMTDLLQDPYFEVRSAACLALSKLGGEGPPALQRAEALVSLLSDNGHTVRTAAASAIGTLGLSHPIPAQGLASVLADPCAGVRASAVYALGKLRDSAIPHAASISLLTHDENAKVRESAAHAMGKLNDAAKPYMQRLIRVVHDENANVRAACANALGNLGHLAKPYASELAGMLHDADVDVRASAAFAFGKLDDAAVPYIDVLKEMSNHPRAKLHKAAGCALGKLGYEVVSKDGSPYAVRNKGDPYDVHTKDFGYEVISTDRSTRTYMKL